MLDIAVVGAGIMGANHTRTVANSVSANLAAVIDPDRERSEAAGKRFDVPVGVSIAELPASVDAAIVATPTVTHEELSLALIERGIHLLVEKPLGPTVESARRIVDAAKRAGTKLCVGHIERHNPAILELPHLLDSIIHMEIARVSPFSSRIAESVALDLMIHDLDLMLALGTGPVTSVQAVGRSILSNSEDYVAALIGCEDGQTASLTASRIGQHKIRRVEIAQRDSFVTVDLVRQDIQVTRVTHDEFVTDRGATYRQQALIEVPYIATRGEPLQLQLEDFVDAIAHDQPVRVAGEDGVAAVELCLRVIDEVRSARQ